MKKLLTALPQFVEKHMRRERDGTLETGDAVLTAMRDAMRVAHELAEQMAHAVEIIKQDTSRPAAANHIRIKQVVERLSEQAAKALDAAHQKAVAEMGKIAAHTAPAQSTNAVQLQLAGEVRQCLRNLDDARRDKLVGAAIANGDDGVVAAIMSGPAFLSGITETAREARLSQWRRRRYPDVVERERRMGRALEAVRRAGESLPAYANSLLAPESTDAAERASAADAAAQARAE